MPTMTQAGYRPPETPIKKATKPQPPKKKKKKHKKKRHGLSGASIASLAIFAFAVLIGAGTIYVYTVTQPYRQAYLQGTMIMGYPLGGAAQENAQQLLDSIEADLADGWKFEIRCQNQSYTLSAEDVKLKIDKEATLAPLWAQGHAGGMLSCFADMARLRREPLAAEPVLVYDMTAVDELLEAVRADVECDPVDATVAFKPGSAEPFVFTDEETGYRLDVSGVSDSVKAHILRLAPGSLTLEPDVVEPKVYRAVLENAAVMRSRVMVQLEGDKAGIANAALAVRAMNGARLEAGETLSFNGLVGRRTPDNGYAEAEEPAYGANAVGIGGGVCQASTLLYRAALAGGLEIAERSAAVRPVPYCEMGQEAAVSDQGLDLRIRNQTETPMFLMSRTYEEDGRAYAEMTLIGEALGVEYALRSSSRETITIAEPVYVRDREGRYATYSDQHVPVSEALMGYSAIVERVELDENGQEAVRETISQNEYAAVAPMIYVGVTERE